MKNLKVSKTECANSLLFSKLSTTEHAYGDMRNETKRRPHIGIETTPRPAHPFPHCAIASIA
jgi:hypothetical protein